MIEAKTFIQRLEKYCPQELAEEGDPVGLHIGTLDKSVERIMMTLDIRPSVVQEAIDKKVDLIIAKHPPIFRPIKRLVTDNFQTKMYADLLKHEIAVYAAHTNMDIVEPGLNDWFCEMLDVKNTTYLKRTHTLQYKKLVVYVPMGAVADLRDALHAIGVGKYSDNYDSCSYRTDGIGRFRPVNQAIPTIGSLENIEEVPEARLEFVFLETLYPQVLATLSDHHPYEEPVFDIYSLDNLTKTYGLGRIGDLDEPMTLNAFTQKVKATFNLEGLRLISNDETQLIQRIAICGGSGEKFYPEAVRKQADVYITGDVYYHTAHDILEEGLAVIDPGHYIEEVCKPRFIQLFNQWKEEEGWDVEFIESEVDTNPFKFK